MAYFTHFSPRPASFTSPRPASPGRPRTTQWTTCAMLPLGLPVLAAALLPSRPTLAPSRRGGVPVASAGGSRSVASDGSWLRRVLDRDEQDRFTLATVLHQSREEAEQDRTELTYGEFDLDGFHHALDCAVEGLPDLRRCTFCDLGSGAGRLVLAAAARYPWAKCVGIEALPELHHMAGRLHALAIDAAATADEFCALSPCEFRALEVSPATAAEALGAVDVLFAFSTCFDDVALAGAGEPNPNPNPSPNPNPNPNTSVRRRRGPRRPPGGGPAPRRARGHRRLDAAQQGRARRGRDEARG